MIVVFIYCYLERNKDTVLKVCMNSSSCIEISAFHFEALPSN